MLLIGMLLMTNWIKGQTISTNWIKGFQGSNQESVKSITKDIQGNIYTTGYFSGSVDFDPGPASFILSSAGQQDIFVSKLKSDGDFVWAKRLGGTGNEMANAIVADSFGHLNITGFYMNTVDFDPGPASMLVSSASAGSQDVFVVQLDTAGNYHWVRTFGGSGYYNAQGYLYDAVSSAYSIGCDRKGNIYACGSILGTMNFNTGSANYTLSSLLVSSSFIFRLDSSGQFCWAKQFGQNNSSTEAYALSVDPNGFVYTTGVFSDSVDFDPSISNYWLYTSAYNSAFTSWIHPVIFYGQRE